VLVPQLDWCYPAACAYLHYSLLGVSNYYVSPGSNPPSSSSMHHLDVQKYPQTHWKPEHSRIPIQPAALLRRLQARRGASLTFPQYTASQKSLHLCVPQLVLRCQLLHSLLGSPTSGPIQLELHELITLDGVEGLVSTPEG